jgi:hypothetical protein
MVDMLAGWTACMSSDSCVMPLSALFVNDKDNILPGSEYGL